METQFSRTELLLGKEAMDKLKKQGWQSLVLEESADMCVRRWCAAA